MSVGARIRRAAGGAGGIAALVVPVLAGYLFLGGCGEGKKGFVLGVRAWGVSVTAAWCSA